MAAPTRSARSTAISPTAPTTSPPARSTSWRRRGAKKLMLYGISSGALRAAMFAERHPERVARLALDSFVWTGKGSPTLAERKKKLPEFQSKNRRPIDRAFVRSVFDRDHPGCADDATIEAFASAILVARRLGADRHLRRHVLPAAAGRPGEDQGAHHRDARRVRRHRRHRGPARVLPPAAALRQAVHRPGRHLARDFQQKNYLSVYHVLHSFYSKPDPVFRG